MAKASLARDVAAVARGETLSCLWEEVDRVKVPTAAAKIMILKLHQLAKLSQRLKRRSGGEENVITREPPDISPSVCLAQKQAESETQNLSSTIHEPHLVSCTRAKQTDVSISCSEKTQNMLLLDEQGKLFDVQSNNSCTDLQSLSLKTDKEVSKIKESNENSETTILGISLDKDTKIVGEYEDLVSCHTSEQMCVVTPEGLVGDKVMLNANSFEYIPFSSKNSADDEELTYEEPATLSLSSNCNMNMAWLWSTPQRALPLGLYTGTRSWDLTSIPAEPLKHRGLYQLIGFTPVLIGRSRLTRCTLCVPMIFEELVEMWSVSSSTPPGSADVPGVRSGVNLFLVSLSQAALEQVQSNLAPCLSITGYTATGLEQLCSFMLLRYFGAVVQDRQIGCRREGITGDNCVHASHLRCWNKLTLNWPWIEMPPVISSSHCVELIRLKLHCKKVTRNKAFLFENSFMTSVKSKVEAKLCFIASKYSEFKCCWLIDGLFQVFNTLPSLLKALSADATVRGDVWWFWKANLVLDPFKHPVVVPNNRSQWRYSYWSMAAVLDWYITSAFFALNEFFYGAAYVRHHGMIVGDRDLIRFYLVFWR
uniref:Uncharacterized protein n=1 Tax=Timema poppense TaxID=170557 RepID=A0A7R9H183_TIMPO|nr:unnamed protein product [Timema poppensis]